MAVKYHIIPTFPPNQLARFMSQIAPPDGNGCELWTGKPDSDGYGTFHIGPHGQQKHYRAHRVAYFLHYGVDPGELLVCHNCPGGDNPACTARDHLFLGTATDNNRDAMRKGRTATGDRNGKRKHPELILYGDDHPLRRNPELAARGEHNGNSRLTIASVREILAFKGMVSSCIVGPRYGVSAAAVLDIWKRKTWKHVT